MKKFLFSGLVVFVVLGGLLFYRKVDFDNERQKIVDDKSNFEADKIVVEKQHRKMHLIADGKILREYKIDLGWNPEGNKEKEGDGRTPEGVYKISYKNPKSKYFLSLRISYPNEEELKKAKALGVDAGGDIMIHGLPNVLTILGFEKKLYNDWTRGCIAVQSNEEMAEIWKLIKIGTSIEIRP